MSKADGSDSKNTLYCSFCGKSQHEVRKLIAGPTVFICDECVDLCMDIIGEENKRHRASLGFRYTQASAPERTHRGRRLTWDPTACSGQSQLDPALLRDSVRARDEALANGTR
jgi:hypothetical protein